MGTSANLVVIQGQRALALHTSYDGHTDNVMATVCAPIAQLGLDLLRTNFGAAQIYDEDQEGRPRRGQVHRDNITAYLEACEARGLEPFDIEGMLHYPYGRSDFAHSGGGLLYGPQHVSDSGFVGDDFQEMVKNACYVLDLDAGTLFVNYEKFWTVDLTKLEGRDPESVFHFLGNYPFYENEDLIPEGITRENAHTQDYNVALNTALAALPSAEDAPTPADVSPAALPDLARSSLVAPENEDGSTWLVRVHPADFVLVRMLSQVIQQTALVRPEFQAVVDLQRVERSEDNVGLVVEKVPGHLLHELQALGDEMVRAFGALTATLDPDGGHSIKTPHASIVSTGWSGGGPNINDDEDDVLFDSGLSRPKAEELSGPFSFEQREQLRSQWISELTSGTAGDPDRQRDALRSEAFLALATFDPSAYAQLSTPDVTALIGPIVDQMEGVHELAVPMARVESKINAQGLRDRYNAMPQYARDALEVGMNTLARHEFHLALGLPTARRPRSP